MPLVKKGRYSSRVEKWGKWVGYEKRMAQYLIAELITAGLVKREIVKGHANWWIITDVYGNFRPMQPIAQQLKNKI